MIPYDSFTRFEHKKYFCAQLKKLKTNLSIPQSIREKLKIKKNQTKNNKTTNKQTTTKNTIVLSSRHAVVFPHKRTNKQNILFLAKSCRKERCPERLRLQVYKTPQEEPHIASDYCGRVVLNSVPGSSPRTSEGVMTST